MANGYAMASIIGKENIMSAAQSTFISSTNWTERIGPVAAIETIKKYSRNKVDQHIIKIGKDVQNIWEKASEKYGLDVDVTGLPTLSAFSFRNQDNQKMMTAFVIEMLKRGFLAFRQFKPSYAHTNEDIQKYSEAVDQVFEALSKKI